MVPTIRRKVRYAVWATDHRGLTVLVLRDGVETVKEQPYCLEHSPKPPLPLPSPIERSHRFESSRSYQRLRWDYGLDEG